MAAGLIYVLIALLVPRRDPVVVGAIAAAVCIAVESAQLTGIPAALVDVWEPFRYALGTTFNPVDLLAYVGGSLVALLVDRRLGVDAAVPAASRSSS